jgi:uncharacterized protein YndB with AHSA1/START domain
MTMTHALTITPEGDRNLVFTREFNATRDLVFEALTTPALLKKWLLAPGREMTVCEIDLRVGGAFYIAWSGPGKKDVGMRGVHREIVPNERIVRTETWDDWKTDEIFTTTTLTEHGGKTLLRAVVTYPTADIRAILLKNGMVDGAEHSYQKLEEVLDVKYWRGAEGAAVK